MKKNKNYFQNKAETSFKGFKWFIYALLACASYTYLFINLFNFDDNWKMFMNTLLTIIIVPMFFSLGNKFLDRFFHFQDTYQLCIETEYKYEHGLIDKPEYERRMKELKKMENKIVSPYNKKTKKTKKKGNNYMLTAILTGVIVIIFLVLGSVFFRNCLNWGDGLISYAGAIVGGGLTLIGVVMTLLVQEQNRKEDLSIQYKPIIMLTDESTSLSQLSSIKLFEHKSCFSDLFFIRETEDINLFQIQIKNIGRGNVNDLYISDLQITADRIIKDSITIMNYKDEFKTISVNESLQIILDLPTGIELEEDYVLKNNIHISCILNFKDEFCINNYQNELILDIEIFKGDSESIRDDKYFSYYLNYKLNEIVLLSK